MDVRSRRDLELTWRGGAVICGTDLEVELRHQARAWILTFRSSGGETGVQ